MCNIIIADDHALVRQGLCRIIEEVNGYNVIGETGDGLEITPLVRRLKPDMIVLDISMPHLRGIEAIHRIRKINKKVKILILTMHKNEDYVYDCLVAGAQGYILKEDADTELISAIETIKQGKVYVSASFASEVIKVLVMRKDKVKNRAPLGILSRREREIFKLIGEGNSNKKISTLLSISIRTVEHHRVSIMKKLGVSNIAGLIKHAIKTGLVDFT